jgi:hypothetical protein
MATGFSNKTDGAMPGEWIAMEHYRMHIVEGWPDSPRKASTLAAIQSALGALVNDHRQPECHICRSRSKKRSVVEFPTRLAA